MLRYLLNDFVFQPRRHIIRVFICCCPIVGEPIRGEYPSLSIDMSGCGLTEGCVQFCYRMVQSYVLIAGHSHQSFSTEQTLDLVCASISNAGVLFVESDFVVWDNLCGFGVADFIESFCRLYCDFLAERSRASDEHYSECNRANRLARAEQSFRTSSVVRSTLSSSVEREESEVKKVVEKTASTKRGSKSKNSGNKASCN